MFAGCRPRVLFRQPGRCPRALHFFVGYSRLALFLVPLAILAVLLYQPTIVDGPSMQPTLHHGQLIWTDRTYYWHSRPQVGEVVVFRAGGDAYVKRVYALPGDVVYFLGGPEDRTLPVRQSKVQECLRRWRDAAEPTPLRIPDDCVYVLGDNTADSIDSRTLGPVPLRNLIGRARLPVDVTRCLEIEYVPPALPESRRKKQTDVANHAHRGSTM